MLKEAAGIKKTDAAIEDLFPDEFYLGCVNRAYGIALSAEQLPEDGSDMITKRVENALEKHHARSLDKRIIMDEMLRQFDQWTSVKDLPKGTAARAEALFKKINGAFAPKK